MATVWKLILQPQNVQEIQVPIGSELLCAREQHEQICLWYRCDPSKSVETRILALCGIGHPAPEPDEARYIGTAFLMGGQLVFHVFERAQP